MASQGGSITSDHENPADMSLVLGGPLYRLYVRCHLARPPIELVWRRISALVLLTWVPLAVLSVIEGRALGGVEVPFIEDLSTHVRFLVSLPILIFAEMFVYKRIKTVKQFVERGIIAPKDQPRFDNAVSTARRLGGSTTAEVLLLILA